MQLQIGTTENEEGDPLFLSSDDLKAHAHGIGASRAGKSKLIEHIARQFIKSRQGFCLIDPGGFLYQELVQWLAYVRPSRADITLFDPSYENRVVGFDPLHIIGEKSEAAISARVDRIVSLTLKALGVSDLANAPRLERVMRCIYYVLIEQDLSIDAVRYFLNPRHFGIRDKIIDQIQSEAIKDQWLMLTSKRQDAYINIVESTANRLFKFLTQPTIRRTLAVPSNSIDVSRIINNRGSLLVNLRPTDYFSEDSARIIGTFLVNEIWSAIRRRSREEVKVSPKFFLVVDEFQNFATPDFAQMLDQSAKYGLHLMLFHQNYDQLDSRLQTAMTACHTRFVFGGITQTDASRMLAGSIPYSWTLREDLMAAPSLFQRHFLLKRPEQPLAYAFTPFVKEYRLPQPKIDRFIEGVTSPYLSPGEIEEYLRGKDAELAKSAEQEAKSEPSPVDIGEALTGQVSADKPKQKDHKRRTGTTYLQGRGSKHHREIQRVVERMAETYGFKSEIEKPVLDGTGSVDVSLEKDGLKIACEVSVTSSAEYEAHNVLKCLKAGYQHVLVVVSNQKNIPALTAKLRAAVPVIDQAKVKPVSLSGCLAFFREVGSPIEEPVSSKKSKLAGQRLSFDEAAAFFDVSTSTLYRWVRAGKIPFYRPGREYQFDRDELVLIGRHELSGKRKARVDLAPVKIEKPKPKTKKQQDDRYRKLLNLD